MTKPATTSMRAFAIRKARRYRKRDGKWLTDEAIDDILETIEEFTGLRYSGQSLINWVTAWRYSGIVRPKQQRPWANYKDKGWRKTPFAAEKRISYSCSRASLSTLDSLHGWLAAAPFLFVNCL